ncbi:hypothetical protein LCGC14_2753590, partial [marine sediment metagenome]
MSEQGVGTWPEQNAIDEWWRAHSMELKKAVSAYRIQRDRDREAEAVEAEPACWMVTCEDHHVGYFPSVYTDLCDFAAGNNPMPVGDKEPEDRCLKKRTAVPLYTH